MPRLATYHEATIRSPGFDSSKLSRTSSLPSGMPRVLMLILVGITVGAALTVATMAMTDTPASKAEGQVAKGGNTDQGLTAVSAQDNKRPVPRNTMALQDDVGMHGKWQRPAQWLAVTSQPAKGLDSSWQSDQVLAIPQQLEGRRYVGSQAAPLQPSDFVHAIVTSANHEYLAMETRLWRHPESRAFIATNYTTSSEMQAQAARLNETWAFYPDDRPLRSLALQGDSRAALTPFLAHKHFGDTYKWLFYGDDDTLFLSHALLHTLQDLDPDMPYFLTDHMWWSQYFDGKPDKPDHRSVRHPHPLSPRCVPCQYSKNVSWLPFKTPAGCPCTPELLCNADPEQEFLVKSGPRGACGMPRVPIRTYSMHGGAGAVLSVGLMKAISFEWFEDCVHQTYSTGGDAMISICLWEAGYGMTDIDPMWHPRNQSMFDVGRVAQLDTEDIRGRLAVVLRTHLQKAAGTCNDMCQLEWNHTLSLHMRSRKFPSHMAHAEVSRMLAGLADIAAGKSNPFDQKSKNETMKLVNAKVVVGLEAIRELSKIGTKPGGKDSKPLGTLMEDAGTAAAEAVAQAVLDAIWDAAKNPPAPPPPPSPTPMRPPPSAKTADAVMSRLMPTTL